jgi:hypothetical protein
MRGERKSLVCLKIKLFFHPNPKQSNTESLVLSYALSLAYLLSELLDRQSTRKSTIDEINSLSNDLALCAKRLSGSCHVRGIAGPGAMLRNEKMVSTLKRVLDLPDYLSIDEVVRKIGVMRDVESIVIPDVADREKWERPMDGGEEVLAALNDLNVTMCNGIYARLEEGERELSDYNRLRGAAY